MRKGIIFAATDLILFLLMFAFIATNACAAEYEWVSAMDCSLGWGDSVAYNGYTITAKDFDLNEDGYVEYVYIVISRDGETIKHAPLQTGGSIEFENDFRVHVKKLESKKREGVKGWVYPVEPHVGIQVFKANKKVPKIEISIDNAKGTYDPKKEEDSDFISNITISNKGKETIKDVNVLLNISPMHHIDGKLEHHYFEIEPDESKTFEITIEIPHLWEKENLPVNVTVTGVDPDNVPYNKSIEKHVTIEKMWELHLDKALSGILYIDRTAFCSLIIRNGGIVPLGPINVTDTFYEMIGNESSISPYNTTVFLEPGETIRIIEYPLTPDKPGTYVMKEAFAVFVTPEGKEHNVSSARENCEVVGPYIVLNKTAEAGTGTNVSDVIVKLHMVNTGNVDAYVNVTDQLPAGASIVAGDKNFTSVIKKGSSASFSYTLQVHDIQGLQVPPAMVSYFDIEGYNSSFVSEMTWVTLNQTNVSEPVEKAPSSLKRTLTIALVFVALSLTTIMIMLRMVG